MIEKNSNQAIYRIESKLEESIFPPANTNGIPHKEEFDSALLKILAKLKLNNGADLSRQEIALLYGFPIMFADQSVEQNLKDAIRRRNQKKDIDLLINGQQEWEGFLSLNNLTEPAGLELPEVVTGTLAMRNLTSLAKIELPKVLGGELWLAGIATKDKAKLAVARPDLAHKIT